MRRLAWSLLLVVLVGVFAIGVGMDELFNRYNEDAKTPLSEIQSFGQAMALALDTTNSPDELIAAWPNNHQYGISLDSVSELALPDVLTEMLIADGMLTLGSEHGVLLHFHLPKSQHVLSVQTVLGEDTSNSKLSWALTILFYLATLGLLLLWLLPLLQRHRLLRESTQTFGQGNLNARIDTRGVSYIHDIEHSFNNMAGQIQQLIEDNKMLTSAVSHDLRTPLARLRFGVDTLAHTSVEESKVAYLKRINNDLAEMESLVESLLHYAKLDNVLDDVAKQHIDIDGLISECIAQHYDNNIDIEYQVLNKDVNDSIGIYGGIEHIATLINNLLNNALKYAKKTISIQLSKVDDQIAIQFCDDGPGIPKELRLHVLKPFERAVT